MNLLVYFYAEQGRNRWICSRGPHLPELHI
ncbi:hypothetical protein CHELA40_15274 [Chelatococcus asaccharovorans]|nr:hypothetical protein CHELA40_15274 [Chelatococcus asaccharovorans]